MVQARQKLQTNNFRAQFSSNLRLYDHLLLL